MQKSYLHWTKVIKGPTCHCILSCRWVNTSCIQPLMIFCKKLHRIVSEYACETPVESEVSKHCFSAPGCIQLLNVNNWNTRAKCKICSELTIKTPDWRQWHRSDIFIVNVEHISHLVLIFPLFLLLTFNI